MFFKEELPLPSSTYSSDGSFSNAPLLVASNPTTSSFSVILHSSQEIIKFLKHVGFGEQDKAEEMLKKNPKLATVKGDLVDCSVDPQTYQHRVFPNITAFQYAVWALDYHMWTMLKKYLSKEDLYTQMEEINQIATIHEQQGWLIKPGKSTKWPSCSWTPLIKALDEYIKNYDAWDVIQCGTYWRQQVGGAQLLLPAHVINEYSHPSRPFYPCPQYVDTEGSLPRTGVNDWIYWGTYKLGKDFAWWRGASVYAPVVDLAAICLNLWCAECDGVGYSSLSADIVAISKLLTLRAAQAHVLLASMVDFKVRNSPQCTIT